MKEKKRYLCVLILIAYGIICASVMWKYSSSHYIEDQMPARVQTMQQALDEVAAGRIPNLFNEDYQRCFYLFVPYLAYRLGGITNSVTVLRLCQNIYSFVLFSMLPLLCYIGLGFEKNPYGIYYLDECAIKKVQEINPELVYASVDNHSILPP